MPGLSGGSELAFPFYSPAGATLKPSTHSQQLARRCRELVRSAAGFPTVTPMNTPTHHQAPHIVEGVANSFCLRLWHLATSSAITVYNQPVRSALRELWTVLLSHEVPPVMKHGTGLQAGLPTLPVPGDLSAPAHGTSSLAPFSHSSLWAESTVDGLVSQSQAARKYSRRRATGGKSWLENETDTGSQPKPRVRLIVTSGS